MEVKIDKRTKEYKDSMAADELAKAIALVESSGATVHAPPQDTDKSPPQSPDKPDFSKAENNRGFKLCMHCGCDLPPSDDGSPKVRSQPELCHACIWRNDKKAKAKD